MLTKLSALFDALITTLTPDLPGHTSPPLDSTCTACDSPDLDTIEAGVYACRACGYEGGPLRMAYEARQQAERAAALPEDERRARAQALLLDADRILLSCEGAFQRAATCSDGGASAMEEDHNDRAYHLALGELYEALELVRRATVLDPFTPQPRPDRIKDADSAGLRITTGDMLDALIQSYEADLQGLQGHISPAFPSHVSRSDAVDALAWLEAYRGQLRSHLAG